MTPIEQLQSLRTRRILFGMCVKKAGNRYMAEELFQNTMLKALRNLERYEDQGKMIAWLGNICHTSYIDMLRAKKYRANLELKDVGWYERNRGEYFGEVERVWEKVEELNEKERMVVEMLIDGESYENMREHFGVPEGTLKGFVNRTRKKLAAKLGLEMIKFGGYKEIA